MPVESGGSKPKNIVIEYQPTAGLFRRATHAAWRAQTPFKVLFALVLALVAAMLGVTALGADPADQLPVVACMLLGVGLYYAYPLIAYYRKPEYRAPVRLEFSKDGFSYRRGTDGESLDWSAVHQIASARHFYILTMARRFQLAVPKAEFTGGQEQHFRILAATEGVPIRD